MTRTLIASLASLACLAACSSAPRTAAPEGEVQAAQLKVMTYNVNFGMAGDPSAHLLIRDEDPDVVLLQETTPAWESALRETLSDVYPHMAFKHCCGAGGLAILSKHPIDPQEYARAPKPGWFPSWRVLVRTPIGVVQTLNVHLRPPVSDSGSFVAGYFSTPEVRLTEITSHSAHLDPDLIADAYPRETGWRPCLGQTGAAQGHLRKQQVGVGDLFLFFGLFRDVEKQGRRWQFVKQARPFHGLWGWLQIGEVYRIDELSDSDLRWARYHPHFHGQPDGGNTLYVASEALQFEGRPTGLAGAGVFGGLEERQRLTAPDAASTTQWRLPGCFYPGSVDTAMSFHGNLARWSRDGEYCTLKSASRGQEFVLDTIEYPGVVSWLREIL